MVLRLSLQRRNFKDSAINSSFECLLSNTTGNSGSQNVILETTENTTTWEIELRSSSVFVRKYVHNGCILILLEMN